MSYCTQTDLETRFGTAEVLQLADRDNDGEADAGVVAQALADADAECDGYLGARYALPLASVPAALQRVVCDIARYRLFNQAAPAEVRSRYQDAVKLLQALADGRVSLGLAPPPSGQDLPEYAAGDRVFTPDTLKDY